MPTLSKFYIHFFSSYFSGSKFAPYGKDGCKINDGNYDQSDNSMDSGRYSASRHRINRVNSSDSQCYFERPPSSHSRSNSRAASTSRLVFLSWVEKGQYRTFNSNPLINSLHHYPTLEILHRS